MADNRGPRRRRRYPRDTPFDRPPRCSSARAPSFLVDRDFDRLLPDDLRAHGEQHFTPVAVARRAARLLVDQPGACILDVGSAVGKFCIVGAEHTDGVFVGVEQRPRLARVATAIASALELPNVTFHHADLVEIDWTPFDGFYLFNPFVEHLPQFPHPLDQAIDLDPARYLFYVRFVRERLAEAKMGTRVVTYHGFGAPPPEGYVLKADEACGTGRLELWIKEADVQRRRRTGDASVDDPLTH